MAKIRQGFEKCFTVSRKGVKMKHIPLKFWHLKFLFLLFSKPTIFAKFSKNHVLTFYRCLASVLSIVYNDFLIFDNVIRIKLKVHLIRII